MAIEDLKPIQRYDLSVYESGMFGSSLDIEKDNTGEWCKWEDVEKVMEELIDLRECVDNVLGCQS